MLQEIIKEIDSKDNVVILGFGREGKSTYNLIRKYLPNKFLTILDGNEELLNQNVFLKEDKNIKVILGDKYLDGLEHYDLIIKAPGVNFKKVKYERFEDKITSQMDLFFRYATCKTIGITGTKGKSTTTSLLYFILKELNKKVKIVGNIGIPVFDEIEYFDDDTIVVAELSCHQLKFLNASPNISILLNLYEEHLDLYRSYQDYVDAKLNIFKYQKNGDYNIWEIDSKKSKEELKVNENTYEITFDQSKINSNRAVYLKEDKLYLKNDLGSKVVYDASKQRLLLGKHNLYNIAAAICVCDILNLDLSICETIINKFKPLEHRMELVGTFNGITFYNDSIATIPQATINCIKSVPNTQTIIIGGMDRGLDLSMLVNYLYNENDDIKTCIFLKDTGYNICDELEKLGCDKRLIKAKDMVDAVKSAYLYTQQGFACVLSPAAASYNTYKNFEERGKDYKKWIKELG